MLCFVFAILVVLLDQFVKRWIMLTMAVGDTIDLVPGLFGLTHVPNSGAAFSILSNQRWLLIGIAVVATLLLIAILLRYSEGFWSTLGLAAVLGGTVGNLTDRILLGYVVDMFEFQFMRFAIFNVADIFITLGGITFLISFIVLSFKPAETEPRLSDDEEDEYIPAGRPVVEEQIGLYDFQYGEDLSDTGFSIVDELYSAPAPSGYDDSGYAPDSGAGSEASPEDMLSSLGVVSELEQELQSLGGLDDYDLDDLLREYGFEDDSASL